MAYAIKAEVVDPRARTFTFTARKTMYGGKLIAEGDPVFVFASENEGGQGLVARSNISPTGMTAGLGLSSISNSIGKQLTKSSAFPTQQRHSSASASNYK
jgi:hypothetical protein